MLDQRRNMEVGIKGFGLHKFRELEVQCTAVAFFASVVTFAGTVRSVQQLHFLVSVVAVAGTVR